MIPNQAGILFIKRMKADNSLSVASVTADFTMHNLGSAPESMAVRFPISTDDGRGKYPKITDLAILEGEFMRAIVAQPLSLCYTC